MNKTILRQSLNPPLTGKSTILGGANPLKNIARKTLVSSIEMSGNNSFLKGQ
jgi:hypothetical protein